ncbi:MoaA/NifB/PqqE/SkfB family radical SAM enzyme [Lachnospiraceae bacterium PF1-21]
MKKEHFINTVALDVTYQCPFRCIHCFNSSGEHKNETPELSNEEWDLVVDELVDINVAQFSIGGGEALLRKELLLNITEKIYNSGKNSDVAIVSNGYYMTEEFAEELGKRNVLNVQISLDGFKNSYQRIRKKENAYEKAIAAIKNLNKAGINVAVSFAPTTFNIPDLSELIDFLRGLEVRFFRCQPLMLLGRAEKNLKDYMPTYEDYRKISEILDKKRKEYPEMYIEWGDPIDHLVRGRLKTAQASYITIGAYGDIYASPYLPITFGNIRKHTINEYLDAGLLDIWKNPFLQKVSEQVVDTTSMSLSGIGLPKIFTENSIELDVLDVNYESNTSKLIDDYFDKGAVYE